MSKVVASVDRDGDAQSGTTIHLNATGATQVNMSINGLPLFGVEFDAGGSGGGTIGWYPPDQPDTWIELGRFEPETGTSVTDAL